MSPLPRFRRSCPLLDVVKEPGVVIGPSSARSSVFTAFERLGVHFGQSVPGHWVVLKTNPFQYGRNVEQWRMKPELGFDDDGRPVLITGQLSPTTNSIASGMRNCLTLMAFRVPALILAALAYGACFFNGLVSLAIIALSLPLPWMAVLIANDRRRGAEEPAAMTTRIDAHRSSRAPRARHSIPAPARLRTNPCRRPELVGRHRRCGNSQSAASSVCGTFSARQIRFRSSGCLKWLGAGTHCTTVRRWTFDPAGADQEATMAYMPAQALTTIWTHRVRPRIWCACI